MKKIFSIAIAAFFMLNASAQHTPKHEFRGAWMHTIGQKQYGAKTPDETRAYLTDQIQKLKEAGVNAIIWQIRPHADAGYPSALEPWSMWMTGEAGKTPTPMWDPLQFMVDLCHKQGMELHAWINPYRVTPGDKEVPPQGHIYYDHPEWFLKYADGKLYFDPGLPESRNYIDMVVRDIVSRYDVDAIHMDDYFYPYPVEGSEFPDTASYAKYGNGRDLAEWRRENVDLLIEQLHNTLQELKPWVQFGISPFGIWRNKKNDPRGSETNGFQCYDGQYADCIKWTEKGWVDYMVPQLYWEQEHRLANNEVLMKWWNTVTFKRGMYYGFSVTNFMGHADTCNSTVRNQLGEKLDLMRGELKNVTGLVWWPGYTVTANHKGVADLLKGKYMTTPALPPVYTWLDNKAPDAVKNLNARTYGTKTIITWQPTPTTDEMQKAVRFVVYRFKKGEKVDVNNTKAILTITGENSLVTCNAAGEKYTYAVTAVDRCNNESKPLTIEN